MKTELRFKFIDLFAGLGGFHLAAERLGGECVFASELNEKLRDAYRSNFACEIAGDVNDVVLSSVPEHDVLLAGFPCQPFSKAGTQLGWKDAARGTLFFKIVEILELRRPRHLLLENVANFGWHDEGRTLRTVLHSLEELGYEVDLRRLSPHEFGIPQIRERLYIVGTLKSLGGLLSFEWPSALHGPLDLATILEQNVASPRRVSNLVVEALDIWQEFLDSYPAGKELPSFPIWAQEFGATYPYDVDNLYDCSNRELQTYKGSFGQNLAGRTKSEILEKLPSYASYEANSFPTWKQLFIRQNRDFYEANKDWASSWVEKLKHLPSSYAKLEWNCKGSTRDIYDHILQFRASGIRVKRRTYSPALVAMTTSQVPYIGWERRFMTQVECSRLQSMENLRTLPSPPALAFKSLGNAVNVKVVGMVLEQLLRQ